MDEVLALAHEHRAPADAEHVEDLARDDVVARPEEPDEHDGDDGGRRDEAERRELVADADAEGERQQRDEEDRGDDTAESRTPLAGRVEPRLREHEHGHERHERQPLALRLPQDAPEDRRVPVVDLPQHEGEIEREGEAADVERDEAGDAADAEHDRPQLGAGEAERPAAADVPEVAAFVRRAGGLLRGRRLACHGNVSVGRRSARGARSRPRAACRGP